MRSSGNLLLLAAGLTLCGCSSLYYSSMKKLGKEKRDILVNRILDGKKAQDEAAKEVKSAYQQFQELTNFEGGDLEKVQKKLSDKFDDVEGRAKKVSDRINSIETVGRDLFKEWNQEIAQMSNAQLKSDSRKMLRDSETRHAALMKQLRKSESRLTPVVDVFRDQVLYLKHNLNARAVKAMKKTVIEVDDDISLLIKEIEAANREADLTIAGLSQEG